MINIQNDFEDSIKKAVNLLRKGGIVAFPTETVYGIGADLMNSEAVKKIFTIKGRSFDKPLAAHVSSIEMITDIVEYLPDYFYLLADKFLPGPLSIILKKKKSVPDIVTSNLDSIGIRYPSDKTALKLISLFGKPIAATSANISGEFSPVSGLQVLESLKNEDIYLIDTGETKFKQESTIVSLVGNKIKLLRLGVIDPKDIEDVLKVKLH